MLKTKKAMVLLSVAASMLLVLALAGTAAAKWVTVTGRAPYDGANEAMAKQQAKDDALRKAVEQVAGAMVNASSNLRDANMVRDNIVSNSRGYITEQKVLFSGPSSDGRSYLVNMEVNVNEMDIRQNIRSQEQTFVNRQTQMENKNVIVLGIKQFQQDFTWATKPFELAVQMVKEKLSQAQFIVLDEGAIEDYAGVARVLKSGQWRKPALYDMAKKAGADWMVIVAMDAIKAKQSPDRAFNSVTVNMRMELIDVNNRNVLTTKYEKATKDIEAVNPSFADWREAATDAARMAAENESRDIVNSLMDYNRNFQPGEPQRYIVEFKRFQDQHVNGILGDIRNMQGFASMRVLRQDSNNSRVQVMYLGTADSLREGLKNILMDLGYNNPRIQFSGNKLVFENTNRF